MSKSLLDIITRRLFHKPSTHYQCRHTNHLRPFNNLPRRCLSSKHDEELDGKNVQPVFPSESDLSKTRRSLFHGDGQAPNQLGVESEPEQDSIYDREFVDMKVEDYESLYQDDPSGALKSQVEIVLKEYEYFKYNSLGRVPSVIACEDMERFFTEGQTPTSRERLFSYFFKREMAKRGGLLKKEQEKEAKRIELEKKFAQMEKVYGEKRRTGLLSANNQLIYGLWHNSLFCRIPENKLRLANSDSRLMEAAMFGRKLIFDFDFENYMTTQTCRSVMDQVQDSYGLNRFHTQEPFDLWFCNFNDNSKGGQYLRNNVIQNLHSGSMITVKNDCFTNHFDKSRLVYLSPHAKHTLGNVWESDDIYIIGVYNDKGSVKHLTYRKAESLGIRSRSLPLDMYLAWQGGSKSLCLNHVTGIMLEIMQNGGDWRSALMKCVPQRKIKPIEVLMEEESKRLAKRKRKFSIRHDFDF